jgi:hypothetical protein
MAVGDRIKEEVSLLEKKIRCYRQTLFIPVGI